MSLPPENHRDEPVPGSELDEKQEVDLSSLLDLQEQREEHESKSTSRVALKSAVGVLIATLLAYGVVPSFRGGVNDFFVHLAECTKPQEPGAPALSGQQQLQELFGSHSSEIDDASRSLGVDPSTVDEGVMDDDVRKMMGESAAGAAQRQRVLQGLKHAAGMAPNKPKEVPQEQATGPEAKQQEKEAAPAE